MTASTYRHGKSAAWKIHRASILYIGITLICQETEVQLTALLIVSLRKVPVFALLLYWLAKQKWFHCRSDIAAARKEDVCITAGKASVPYCWVTTWMHSVLCSVCLLLVLHKCNREWLVIVYSSWCQIVTLFGFSLLLLGFLRGRRGWLTTGQYYGTMVPCFM